MPGAAQGVTHLIGPTGKIVAVDAADAPAALSAGYSVASPKQAHDFETQRKYGGAGQQAIAGLEGAAQGLTAGLSTPIERALGVSAEGIKGREEANPVTHFVSNAAGIAAPLVLTGGAAGAAEAGAAGAARGAAELTAPALIAGAGKAVSGAVRSALPEATGLVGRVLGEGAAVGAGSAIEGAAYGLGHVVHESALGDPNLTAQSALATVGISGLLGGAIGGAGGILSGLAKEAASSGVGTKLGEWLQETEGSANLKAAGGGGGIQPDINRLAMRKGGMPNLNKIGREMADYDLVGPFSTPAQTLERAESLVADANKEATDLLAGADTAPAAPKWGWQQLRDEIEPKLNAALKAKGSTVEVADKLGKVLDNFSEAYAERPLGFSDLRSLKQDLDEVIGYHGKSLDVFAKPVAKPLKQIRDFVSKQIDEGLESVGGDVDAWQAANRKMEVGLTAKTLAQKGILKAQSQNAIPLTGVLGGLGGVMHGGPLGGAVGLLGATAAKKFGAGLVGAAARSVRGLLDGEAAEGVVNATADGIAAARSSGVDNVTAQASSAPETVAALSQLERANQAIGRKIDDMASVLVRGAEKAGRVGRTEASAGIASAFGREPEEALSRHERTMRQMEQLSDPDQMLQRLQDQAKELQDHAPNTAQAFTVTASRMVSFLSSKAPKMPKLGPLAPKLSPSPAEIAKFNRYYEAVNRPLSILKQAAAGTLTPEAVEAVRVTQPQLFGRMQTGILQKLAVHKNKVPYQQKLMLSMLMGSDMDGSTHGLSIIANQHSLTGPSSKGPENQAGSPGIKPTAGGMAKLNVSNRLLTPMQSALRRGDR